MRIDIDSWNMRAPWWKRAWCVIRRTHNPKCFRLLWICEACGDVE